MCLAIFQTVSPDDLIDDPTTRCYLLLAQSRSTQACLQELRYRPLWTAARLSTSPKSFMHEVLRRLSIRYLSWVQNQLFTFMPKNLVSMQYNPDSNELPFVALG